MAGEVETWFQNVTDDASGNPFGGDIIQPIDFVPPSVLETGNERDLARHAAATLTLAPRKDVIAAAIAAGQASVKQNRQTHADMSVKTVEAKKPPAPRTMLPGFTSIFVPSTDAYPTQKSKAASVPAVFQYLKIATLGMMVLSGVVLTHMTLLKFGQPGPLDSVVHHGNHMYDMVRGKHHNKHAKCEEWAAIGGCAKNPPFMKETCKNACYHAPPFDEILVDNNPHCMDWAPKGECLNNPKFMMMHCSKSCSEIGNVQDHQRAEAEAQLEKKEAIAPLAAVTAMPAVPAVPTAPQGEDKSEYCPHWAMNGECTANPSFMSKECPKSCAIARVAHEA
jgi:hypothetical protein